MSTAIKKAMDSKAALIAAIHTLHDAVIYLPKHGVENPFASPFGASLPMVLVNQPGVVALASFSWSKPGRFTFLQSLGKIIDWQKHKDSFYAAETRIVDIEAPLMQGLVGYHYVYDLVLEYALDEHQIVAESIITRR